MTSLKYRFWCELVVALDGEAAISLAAEPATTPRLAIRWMRWHAIHAAEQLDLAPEDPLHLGALRIGLSADTDPTQALRTWEADGQEHERAMAALRDGERCELIFGFPFVSLTAVPLNVAPRRLREQRPLVPPRPPEDSAALAWSPADAGHGSLRRTRSCLHPPTICTTENGVIKCPCGAQQYPAYDALGGLALGVGDRTPPRSSMRITPVAVLTR
ncbi:hypothetical protein [Streptomyces sp. NPDC037389]|uniref:hypothetical protein n=1 Tax=Streptomyces sp. NPDC037389 TaxID=3155369 RepID=UPI0033F2041B